MKGGCGCRRTKVEALSEEHNAEVLRSTRLSPAEVASLYHHFHPLAGPDGQLTFPRFRSMMGMLGMLDDMFLPWRIFCAFDADGNGKLSFVEFAIALGTMVRGEDDVKLELAFKILTPQRSALLAQKMTAVLEDELRCEEEQSRGEDHGSLLMRCRRPRSSKCRSSQDLRIKQDENEEDSPRGDDLRSATPHSQQEGLTLFEFQRVVASLESTRMQLVGSTEISHSDWYVEQLFNQLSSRRPDGKHFMTLEDFKTAVRNSPEFLFILGVHPGVQDRRNAIAKYPSRKDGTFARFSELSGVMPNSPYHTQAALALTVDPNSGSDEFSGGSPLSRIALDRVKLRYRQQLLQLRADLALVLLDLLHHGGYSEDVAAVKLNAAQQPPAPPFFSAIPASSGTPPAASRVNSGAHGETKEPTGVDYKSSPYRKSFEGANEPSTPKAGGVPSHLVSSDASSEGDIVTGGRVVEHAAIHAAAFDEKDSLQPPNPADLYNCLTNALPHSLLLQIAMLCDVSNDSQTLIEGPLTPPIPSPSSSWTDSQKKSDSRPPRHSSKSQSSVDMSNLSSVDCRSPVESPTPSPIAHKSRAYCTSKEAPMPQQQQFHNTSMHQTYVPPLVVNYATHDPFDPVRGTSHHDRNSPEAALRSVDGRKNGGTHDYRSKLAPSGESTTSTQKVSTPPSKHNYINERPDISKNEFIVDTMHEAPCTLFSSSSMHSAPPSSGFLLPGLGRFFSREMSDIASCDAKSPPKLSSRSAIRRITSTDRYRPSKTDIPFAGKHRPNSSPTSASFCSVSDQSAVPLLAVSMTAESLHREHLQECCVKAAKDDYDDDEEDDEEAFHEAEILRTPAMRLTREFGTRNQLIRVSRGSGQSEDSPPPRSCFTFPVAAIKLSLDEKNGKNRFSLSTGGGGGGGDSSDDGGGAGGGCTTSKTLPQQHENFKPPPPPLSTPDVQDKEAERNVAFSSVVHSYSPGSTATVTPRPEPKPPRISHAALYPFGSDAAGMLGPDGSAGKLGLLMTQRRQQQMNAQLRPETDRRNYELAQRAAAGDSLAAAILQLQSVIRWIDHLIDTCPAKNAGAATLRVNQAFSRLCSQAADGRMFMNKANVSGKYLRTRRQGSIATIRLIRRRAEYKLLGPQKGFAVHFGHPSWNMVLNMMVGIRLAAGRIGNEPRRRVEAYDFVMKEKISILPRSANSVGRAQEGSLEAVRFIDFAPMVFRKLRETFDVAADDYLQSVGPEQLVGNMVLGNLASLSELCSEGRSGAFFYYTADGKYMIKTITTEAARFLQKILRPYYEHMVGNRDTLLTRFFGFHALRVKRRGSRRQGAMLYFIIMGNLFHSPVEIHRRYDLKGSWIGRTAAAEAAEDPSVALKDCDMLTSGEKLRVGATRKSQLMSVVERDASFLQKSNILDYSLLVGVHKVSCDDGFRATTVIDATDPLDEVTAMRNEAEELGKPFHQVDYGGMFSNDGLHLYYMGIIDILTRWRPQKRLEHNWKSLRTGDPNGVSCTHPQFYAKRFVSFISDRLE